MEPKQKALESKLRRKAKRLGLTLTKSWSDSDAYGFPGGYRIINKYNDILAGSCDNLLLKDLSDILDQMEKEIDEIGDVYSLWD
jgi:hypothetical protein